MSEVASISTDPAASASPQASAARWMRIVMIWLVAISLAAMVDAPVARFMRESGVADFFRSHKAIREVLKGPGYYGFTVAVMAIVMFVHALRWKASGFVLVLTMVSGVNDLIKWTVGRTRPFKIDLVGEKLAPFELQPFRGGWEGLFASKNLCFPSGHACLAFATAAALVMLWPRARWRWVFWLGAAMCAIERVMENAHWLSDTVAAAALGIGGAKLLAVAIEYLMRQQPIQPNAAERA